MSVPRAARRATLAGTASVVEEVDCRTPAAGHVPGRSDSARPMRPATSASYSPASDSTSLPIRPYPINKTFHLSLRPYRPGTVPPRQRTLGAAVPSRSRRSSSLTTIVTFRREASATPTHGKALQRADDARGRRGLVRRLSPTADRIAMPTSTDVAKRSTSNTRWREPCADQHPRGGDLHHRDVALCRRRRRNGRSSLRGRPPSRSASSRGCGRSGASKYTIGDLARWEAEAPAAGRGTRGTRR